MTKKVLLHICCGVCAAYSINYLQQKGFFVEGFYFNPNIYPKEEYLKRKDVVEKIKMIFNINIEEGNYDYDQWKNFCVPSRDYETLSENGNRCILCYRLRLENTFHKMQEKNFDFFTTTLTISPHKISKKIFEIGKNIAGEKFLEIDFKKNDGYKKTVEIAKQYSFYRQNYCGCEYSLINKK